MPPPVQNLLRGGKYLWPRRVSARTKTLTKQGAEVAWTGDPASGTSLWGILILQLRKMSRDHDRLRSLIMCMQTRRLPDATVTLSGDAAGPRHLYLRGKINHDADLSIELISS